MRKALFIDRDGTIIQECEDEQIDAVEKLEFLEDVLIYLNKISNELNFELVMVTNQDGLGTEAFPEETFWPLHNLIMRTLKSHHIHFSDVHIDRTYPAQNAPTRKPGTGMLTRYIQGNYDLENSFVIGDRATDIQLAKNLGAKGIFIRSKYSQHTEIREDLKAYLVLDTPLWKEIYFYLFRKDRSARLTRVTKETGIDVSLDLDGTGTSRINTGIGFFDHMLEQLARHSGADLDVKVHGDLHIDEHHTVEDTALALGETFKKALGKKVGIERYGYFLPMDDVAAQVAIDFGGRPWLVWDVHFKREKVGGFPTEMTWHFFKSFSDSAACNLNIRAEGDNEHHKIEAIFKATARAIKMAIKRDPEAMFLPTTKGTL